MDFIKRTWAEIDLDALEYNMKSIKSKMAPKHKVMGIVNVTPDSFSDGGKYFTPEEAVRRVKNLIADGADIIDIGAESTKPGATPLSWEEEWSRLEPVLTLLKGTVPVGGTGNGERGMGTVPISIDTYHPETAERAVALGAKIINCVYEGTVPDMLAICAKNNVEIVIPTKFSGSVPADVPFYLDPMIGFGTTRDEDLELLRSIPELSKRGRVLVGASRKRIVKKLFHNVALTVSTAKVVICAPNINKLTNT